MNPTTYDLHFERQARSTPTAEQVQIASAVGFIESAQTEVAKARRALVAAGNDLIGHDPSGLDCIARDLDRELIWLRG